MVWFGNKCFDFGVGVDCVDFFLIFGIFCEYVQFQYCLCIVVEIDDDIVVV